MRFAMALFLVALALSAAPAWAINKCTGADGKVVYQDQPCASTDKAQEIKVKTAPPAAANSTGGKQMPFTVLPLDPDAAQNIANADVELAKHRLKDPDSAKFESVRVFRFKAMDNIVQMTCGNLNAKNSYGGYVGSKSFWVYEGVFTETFNHYYPKDKSLTYLMGDVQTACLTAGVVVSIEQ